MQKAKVAQMQVAVMPVLGPIVGFGPGNGIHVYDDVNRAIAHHDGSAGALELEFFDAAGRPLEAQGFGTALIGLKAAQLKADPEGLQDRITQLLDAATERAEGGDVPENTPQQDVLATLDDLKAMTLDQRLAQMAAFLDDTHAADPGAPSGTARGADAQMAAASGSGQDRAGQKLALTGATEPPSLPNTRGWWHNWMAH